MTDTGRITGHLGEAWLLLIPFWTSFTCLPRGLGIGHVVKVIKLKYFALTARTDIQKNKSQWWLGLPPSKAHALNDFPVSVPWWNLLWAYSALLGEKGLMSMLGPQLLEAVADLCSWTCWDVLILMAFFFFFFLYFKHETHFFKCLQNLCEERKIFKWVILKL